MFERLMVPVDGSPLAEEVLAQLDPLLRRDDAELVLLRVVNVPLSLGRTDTTPLLSQARAEADRYVETLTRNLRDRGLRARGKVAEGMPAESILAAAAEERADLVAMTTHGRSGISRWVFGSVAEKVIRAADRPLLIHRSFGLARPAGPIRRILVPTDGSAASEAVLPAVVRLARTLEAHVVVLHAPVGAEVAVGAYSGTLGAAPAPSEDVTHHMSAVLETQGLPVTTLTLAGDAASQIVNACKPWNIDLIAMATHGRSGLGRWVLGSVTEKVLRTAPVPTLIVRSFGERRP